MISTRPSELLNDYSPEAAADSTPTVTSGMVPTRRNLPSLSSKSKVTRRALEFGPGTASPGTRASSSISIPVCVVRPGSPFAVEMPVPGLCGPPPHLLYSVGASLVTEAFNETGRARPEWE